MTNENKDGWKTKIRKKRKDGEFNRLSGGLGTISSPSSKTRNDPLRIGRANSDQSNSPTINIGAEIPGGIARQLIDKTKEQLAYHKAQVSELEARLQELEQFSEDLEAQDIEEIEEDE
jgi:hypothetical protein